MMHAADAMLTLILTPSLTRELQAPHAVLFPGQGEDIQETGRRAQHLHASSLMSRAVLPCAFRLSLPGIQAPNL